ncbi:unnamed protein product [Brassica napus]|uniref:(rape) hypothetical protein n=1 Tax=Brassica napus TaxID=3708 RepID=A0A816PEJ3_BRANA|nr:unnamed protein product [Brassica napus]
MRPAYPSSKKVKDYDKFEAESFFSRGDYNVFGILIDSFCSFAQSTGGIYWDSAFNRLERCWC